MELLTQKYGERLRRVIGQLTAWHADVDDLLQDTLMRVWKYSPTYRGEGAFDKWLVSIAYRICRDHQRSLRRRMRNWLRFLDGRSKQNVRLFSDEDTVRESDAWDEIQRAMQELSASDRELLVMFHLESWQHEELAAYLNISTDTLHVRLHRARSRLKQRIHGS